MKGFVLALLLFPTAAFAGGINVVHPWFRYLLPQIPAAGFMVLRNTTAGPVTLSGARSPACGMLMLHESVNSSGMDRMIDVKKAVIPAHGDFVFAPGGYHMMCMQPKMKMGRAVAVTLLFDRHEPVTEQFPVEGPNGPSPP